MVRLLKSVFLSCIVCLFLLGTATISVAQNGPFSAQIQAALRVFLTTAHTWTGVQTFSGGTVFTGVVKLPDGSASAPSLTFASALGTGMWNSLGPSITWSIAGTESLKLSTTYLWVKGGSVLFGSGNTILIEDAANTLAQRNGTNGQKFNIYETYTDASNYGRLEVGLDANGNFGLRATAAGTGAVRAIDLITGASAANGWSINSTTAHLLALTDNALDIGTLGASRPRTGYFGTSIITPTVNATTAYQLNGNAFGTGTVGPSSPVGTTSTAALVMAGLAGSITTRTGRVEICASGNLTDGSANDGTKAQISYGTGTAPTNGAALTGTQAGTIFQYSASTLAAGATAPYGGCVVVTGLTLNTAYWLDMAFAAITGGTGSLTSAYMAAHDIP